MSLDDKLGQLADHLIALTKKVDDLGDHVSTLADQVRDINDRRSNAPDSSDSESKQSSSAESALAAQAVRIRPKQMAKFPQCRMQSNHADWISQTLSIVTEWSEDAAALLTTPSRSIHRDGYFDIS